MKKNLEGCTRHRLEDLTYPELKKKLWETMSLVVRTQEENCYTCGKYVPVNESDAGHFIDRSICGVFLYFYRKNIHKQCYDCNRLKDGNKEKYKAHMIEDYGEDIFQELEDYRIKDIQFSREDFILWIKKLRKYLTSLRNCDHNISG